MSTTLHVLRPQQRRPAATDRPRMVPALTCAAVLDLAVGVTLAGAGQAAGGVALVAYVVITGLGLTLGMSRPVPGGVRLRDLNRAAPCANMLTATGDPAGGFACVHWGYPPAGQFLVAAQIPSGAVIQVCPPCADVIGGLVDVQVVGELTEIGTGGRPALEQAPAAIEAAVTA